MRLRSRCCKLGASLLGFSSFSSNGRRSRISGSFIGFAALSVGCRSERRGRVHGRSLLAVLEAVQLCWHRLTRLAAVGSRRVHGGRGDVRSRHGGVW